MSSMTRFHILFGMTEKRACFELCVSPILRQNQDICNFYGSLTLNNGKLIDMLEIKAVTSCSTHKIDQQETDG